MLLLPRFKLLLAGSAFLSVVVALTVTSEALTAIGANPQDERKLESLVPKHVPLRIRIKKEKEKECVERVLSHRMHLHQACERESLGLGCVPEGQIRSESLALIHFQELAVNLAPIIFGQGWDKFDPAWIFV